MEIMIKCSEGEKAEWLKYNRRRCPFAPCFTQVCAEDARCDECIDNNVKFDLTD